MKRGATPRWSRKQKQNLLLGIGAYGLDWLRRKAGERTRDALYGQIRRSCGGGGLTRGNYTLAEAAEATGYNREQLERAGNALAQRWARTSRTGPFMLSEEQIEQLTAWLKQDYWCGRLRLYGCLRCGTVRQRHRALGLCTRCYWTVRRVAVGASLPFGASALAARVKALLASEPEGDDHDFLALLDARLAHRWAPLEADLARLAELDRAYAARPALEASDAAP
jgi:hypothetical protein